MPGLRRVKPALWVAAGLCAALPASASGAVTIGSNLAAGPSFSLGCSPYKCTLSHSALPSPLSTAPGGVLAASDGVVVRWRIKVGPNPTPAALRITRPGDSYTRTGAGTGPTVTPAANQTSTFSVPLPIQAGDALGIDCCQSGPLFVLSGTGGASYVHWGASAPDQQLQDGEPPRIGTASLNGKLLINADIEPDADEDGFGDETQDQCPTEASTQEPCPPDTDPPETEITKTPPNKSEKPKAKYKFTSDEPNSTFECSLKGKGLDQLVKQFGDCSSSRKYKGLDEGKFKFKVRAIDAAGNVDSSPAKDKFKVVG
jgi:hypothetical protein